MQDFARRASRSDREGEPGSADTGWVSLQGLAVHSTERELQPASNGGGDVDEASIAQLALRYRRAEQYEGGPHIGALWIIAVHGLDADRRIVVAAVARTEGGVW